MTITGVSRRVFRAISISWRAWKRLPKKKAVRRRNWQIAWLLAQGSDIVPIPGTKRRKYLEQNLAALVVRLSGEHLRHIDRAALHGAVAGMRYAESGMAMVNR